MRECLSVVIPAYNEQATLSAVARRVLIQPHLYEVIIVNDCSGDETGRIADELARLDPRVKVAHHATNKGKTEALKTGFALTTGDIVIVQDADLEYDPSEIRDVIEPILEGQADVVYGSRFWSVKQPVCFIFITISQIRVSRSFQICSPT